MIVSIHQPAYLPWLGYLERILKSDCFVFLDTVQLETRSFTSRNRIKTPQGPQWLTVPVQSKGHRETTLQTIRVDDSQPWRRKHLMAIAQHYRRAPRFDVCYGKIEAQLRREHPFLADLCFDQLTFWLAELGISTRVVRARDLAVVGRKSDLMLNFCRHLGAKTYLSGPQGRGYIDEASFAAAGIRVVYHDFVSPVYPQTGDNFTPNLSVVDAWMHLRPEVLLSKELV